VTSGDLLTPGISLVRLNWFLSTVGARIHGPPKRFVRPAMLFGNFQIINIYVAKCFEKRCSEI